MYTVLQVKRLRPTCKVSRYCLLAFNGRTLSLQPLAQLALQSHSDKHWAKCLCLERAPVIRQAGTSIVRSSTVTRHAAPMGQCKGPHLSVGSIYYNAEVYPYSVWRAPPERGGLPSVQ